MSFDKEVIQRLTALETESKAKWEAHDKQSVERHEVLKASLFEIKEQLKGRPCAEHIEKFKSLGASISRAWGFIVLIIAAVIGAWFKGN